MASSKSFFGKRRGSTKNFTFTVFNGKQVTKEKAEQVKNPRTLAQMRNRMVLTTSSAAYAAMKEIVDHSFQGYTYGLQNMSRFQSVNNKLLRENISAETPQFAYCEYGKAKLLPGAYIISEGSAPDLTAGAFSLSATSADNCRLFISYGMPSGILSADYINQKLGLSVGDIATLCAIVFAGNTNGYRFVYVRLISKKAGSVAITTENFGDYYDVESNVPISNVTFGTDEATFDVSVPGVTEGSSVLSATIHSVKTAAGWERNNAQFSIGPDVDLTPSSAAAIATYPVGNSYILNGGDVPGGYEDGSYDGADDGGEDPEP